MSYSAREPILRRPVIASLASADAEFNHWVAKDGYHRLNDMNGSEWHLSLRLEHLPHPENMILPLYRLHIGLSSLVETENLIKSGILDPHHDRRLLGLIGDDKVPIQIKTWILEAKSLETLRSDLASYIYKLRKKLKKIDFSAMRKRRVGEWIDRKSLFGHALSKSVQDKIDLDV